MILLFKKIFIIKKYFRKIKFLQFFLTIMFIILLTPIQTFTWNSQGHIIIAKIAQKRLSEKTKKTIQSILFDHDLAFVANFPDQAKKIKNFVCVNKINLKGNPKWHYLDLTISKYINKKNKEDKTKEFISSVYLNLLKQLNKKEKYIYGKCENIISKLKKSIKNLNLNKENAKEDLINIVHFIGDLTNPLHNADDNDKGGGLKSVFIENSNEKEYTSLHLAWDRFLNTESQLKQLDIDAIVNKLNEEINKTDKKQIKDWENESLEEISFEASKIAIEIYNKFYDSYNKQKYATYKNNQHVIIDKEYIDYFRPKIENQLKKAGVKLAAVLEKALAENNFEISKK